jgi:hypothetical protein
MQPGDFANRRSYRVIDAKKIVVQIQRHAVRIIGSERLRGCGDQFLCEQSGSGAKQAANTEPGEEIAPAASCSLSSLDMHK